MPDSDQIQSRQRLIHGDCMDVLPRLDDESVDLVLTDIPYGEVNRPSQGLRNLDRGAADTRTFELGAFLSECIRVVRGSIYVFCGYGQLSQVIETFRSHDLRSVRACAWEKTNPAPTNGQYGWLSATELCGFARKPGADFHERMQSNVWRADKLHHAQKQHPTEKPTQLLERLIRISSNPGDVVLDPCMGSGAVGEAAIRGGRRFLGVELNRDYFEIAENRIKQLYDGRFVQQPIFWSWLCEP